MGCRINNTFGIEVSCRRYINIGSLQEAQETVCSLTDEDNPLLIVGKGSNLLYTKDFEGTVLHPAMDNWDVVATEDHAFLTFGSGMEWDSVVELCVENGWHGVENLSGIPGDIGSAAVQNIGAYGAEIKDVLRAVRVIDLRTRTGDIITIPVGDINYGYRYSRFKDEWKGRYLIVSVLLKLSTTYVPHTEYGNIRKVLNEKGIGQPTAVQMRQTILDIRNSKLPDPKMIGNAGSFFMNPVVSREKYLSLKLGHPNIPHYDVDEGHVKIPAAWLIEQCGWKGRSLGRAAVHDRQPLVLINQGGATGQDILNLCHAIQGDVAQRFGISLKPEVIII